MPLWNPLLLITLLQPGFQQELTLDQVLSARDFRKYQSEDKYHDRIKILREDLEDTSRRLGALTRQEDLAPAYRVLARLQALSGFAVSECEGEENPKELRHKEVKRLEIAVRKLLEDLEDLRLAVSFREREPYDATIETLTELRNVLLGQLFDGNVGNGSGSGSLAGAPAGHGFAASAPAPAGAAQEALTGLDRFTVEEFDKIRLHRRIVKRTEAFLDICRRRLDEIERRRADIAWTSDDPNPLELHSYSDMLHAYTRALNSLMINIDEKAREKSEEEKEIRKALEKLLEGVQDFGPRLEPFADLVRELKDEELGRKLRLAMKSTAQAEKGALYGLGAPSGS